MTSQGRPHRVRVMVDGMDGKSQKLLVNRDWTFAQFMTRMRLEYRLKRHQALILCCQQRDGLLVVPTGSSLVRDLLGEDNTVRCSLRVQNTFG